MAIAAFTFVASAAMWPAGATAATVVIDYDADLDTDGNSVWEDEENLSGTNLDWNLSSGITRGAASANTRANINFAYTFATGDSASTSGTIDGNTSLPDGDASIEIWFKPTDTTGDEILVDYGGGVDGTSFTLSGSTLQFIAKNENTSADVTADITGLTGDFIQAIGVLDTTTNEISLYVNGVEVTGTPVTHTFTSPAHWAGTDGDGLGSADGGVGGTGGALGNLGGYTAFNGEIAKLRLYQEVIDETDAEALFNAVAVPEPSTFAMALLVLVGVCLAACRTRVLG